MTLSSPLLQEQLQKLRKSEEILEAWKGDHAECRRAEIGGKSEE
jgi:hypothetical protein